MENQPPASVRHSLTYGKSDMRTAIFLAILVCGLPQGVCSAEPPVEQTAGDLRSDTVAVRRHAATSLGRIRDASAVPALIEALKDTEAGVRREAAKALGSIKDGQAVAPLVDALDDPDMNVRLFAAYALGEIKDRGAAAALLAALDDSEWCVRDQAAWALREINDPKIAPALTAALKKKNTDVTHVVWLLRNLQDARIIDLLIGLLDDPDATARMRGAAALGEFPGTRAIDPLIDALEDDNPSVRLVAVQSLFEIGDNRARQPLENLIAREESPSVREAAERAVFQMSPRKHLMAHWSFDDSGTSVAKDVTGHGNDGEIRGCAPVEGRVGHALAFSAGKYVELGQPIGLPIAGTPLTLMAWVKSDAPSGVVVARGGAFCGFSLYIKDGVGRFGIHRVQDEPIYIAAGREQIVGTWVHMAGVIKSDRIELYVNGKLAASEETPGYIPGNCGQGMEIGFDVANSPAEITDNFEGLIDEVKVYHAALSEDDIAKECRQEQ